MSPPKPVIGAPSAVASTAVTKSLFGFTDEFPSGLRSMVSRGTDERQRVRGRVKAQTVNRSAIGMLILTALLLAPLTSASFALERGPGATSWSLGQRHFDAYAESAE
jgi:hypothetical protein